MRMIIRIIRVHRRRPRILIQLRRIQSMIYKRCARRFSRIRSVRDEAISAVSKSSSFPDIVGGGRGDDDGSAFGLEEFGRVVEVGVVSLDGFGYAAI